MVRGVVDDSSVLLSDLPTTPTTRQVARGMIAPDAIVACFRAAILGKSFEDGVNVEMQEFGKLVMSPESASLRNIFFAERAALKVRGVDSKVNISF